MHLLGGVRPCPPYANRNRPQCLLRVICVDFGMSAACPVRGNLGNSDCLVFAGLAHDNRLCSVLLGALLPKTMLLADRGYDADWIRGLAREQGAWANIPPKRNRKDPICFRPRKLHRDRWIIGRSLARSPLIQHFVIIKS